MRQVAREEFETFVESYGSHRLSQFRSFFGDPPIVYYVDPQTMQFNCVLAKVVEFEGSQSWQYWVLDFEAADHD